MIKPLPPKPEHFFAELQRFQDLSEHIGRVRLMLHKAPSVDLDWLLKEQKRLFDGFVNSYRDRFSINRDDVCLFPLNQKHATVLRCVLSATLFAQQNGVKIIGQEIEWMGIEDFNKVVEYLLDQFELLLNDWDKEIPEKGKENSGL